MATSLTPFAHNSALSFQHSRATQTNPKTFHFHTGKWRQMTPTAAESKSFSKNTEAHINNFGSFTGTSDPEKWILKNVAQFLHSMDFTNPDECCETYAEILWKCRKLGNLELGFQVHAHLIVNGVKLCEFLGGQLLEMYCKLGRVEDARKLFAKMPERNVFSWTSMMEMYYRLGDYTEVMTLYYGMIGEGIRPDHFVFPKVFKACSELRDYKVGKHVYDYMLSIGFEGNAWVKRSFLEMFVKCGRIDIARRLFEEMKFKDVFMWNIMVSGYAIRGEFRKALRYINAMKVSGVMPDQVTWNSLIAGFIQNRQLNVAFRYLSELSDSEDYSPDVVSWTAVISGYEKNGYSSQALSLFRKMLRKGVRPNSVTIASVVSCCTNLSLSQHGKEIHGYCIKRSELDSDLLVSNTLVDFYAKCSSLQFARQKFDNIIQKDLISWNSMLSGYALGGCYEEVIRILSEMKARGVKSDIVTWNGLITGFTQTGDGKSALEFLYRMCRTSIKPNSTTLSGALTACAQMRDLRLGKEIHGYLFRHQIELSTGVGSALISMYARCESLELAYSVFGELSTKDVVAWNSIIAACAQSRQGVSALNLLRDMNLVDVRPDTVTMISVLKACSRLAALRQGKEIHQYIIRHGLDTGSFVWNALIDMYGRCGSIQNSRRVFDAMPHKDLVSWNVMISMYGMHGFGMDAVNLFQQMRRVGLIPNYVTFTNLLSACTHSGLVNEGWEYFKLMKEEYAMEPAMEQYACIVDLRARAGQFDESMEFIKEMPFEPNAAVWGSLLGACRIHSNPNLAEYAAKHLFELEPQSSGNYILLANIYSAAGRWEDAAKIRGLMKERGVTKSPGCSWIEVKRKVHSFIAGDASHPSMEAISAKMESLYVQIKKLGYVPETGFVLRKVEEGEKEFSLCGHSEKLALAFGLISTPARTPLRIIKNLRICGDCHTAAKYISKVEEREIIMRDNYRFHHFYQGVCSCGDYW